MTCRLRDPGCLKIPKLTLYSSLMAKDDAEVLQVNERAQSESAQCAKDVDPIN